VVVVGEVVVGEVVVGVVVVVGVGWPSINTAPAITATITMTITITADVAIPVFSLIFTSSFILFLSSSRLFK
jgi:hypothetical protein